MPMLDRVRAQNATDILIVALQRKQRLGEGLLPLLHASLDASRPEHVVGIGQVHAGTFLLLDRDLEEGQRGLARYGGHHIASGAIHEQGHVDSAPLSLAILQDYFRELLRSALELR